MEEMKNLEEARMKGQMKGQKEIDLSCQESNLDLERVVV